MSTPPLFATTHDNAPTMSTAQTLSSIFFEPGPTFEALRVRPRFLVAGSIMLALTIGVTILLFQRIDFTEFMRAQVENSPRAEQMTPEQKEQAIRFQTGMLGKTLVYLVPVISVFVIFAAGGAIYMLGAMAMGGAMKYKQGLSVWVYSSFPPALLLTVASVLLLFLKAREDIDVTQISRGLVRANPGVLLGSDASPILKASLDSLDLFAFYGLFLAALGLRKVARLSSGAAWTVAIGIWLIGVLLKVGWAAMFG